MGSRAGGFRAPGWSSTTDWEPKAFEMLVMGTFISSWLRFQEVGLGVGACGLGNWMRGLGI